MKYFLCSFFTFITYLAFSVTSASVIEWKACTMEYAPVCAKVQVQCFRAPCYPIYTTYSNQCMMSAETQATFVHSDACTTYEEWKPAVNSEKLKTSISLQYDNYLKRIFSLDITAQLLKLESLDTRIKDRINVYAPNASVWLVQEMRTDWFRYAYSYLEDLNKNKIYELQGKITGKRYFFRDTVRCEGVKFKCKDGESAFFDDIWCGCQK